VPTAPAAPRGQASRVMKEGPPSWWQARVVTNERAEGGPAHMLHAGLDLGRRRVDYCLLGGGGEGVEVGVAPAVGDGLGGLVRVVELRHGRQPVGAVIESMNGARFVHDVGALRLREGKKRSAAPGRAASRKRGRLGGQEPP
jgi:hypothetical protein